MNKTDTTYFLFDKKLNQNSLIEFSKVKIKDINIEEWEKEIFSFFLEWFDENDFIKVKTSGSTGIPKEIKLQKIHMKESAKTTLNFLNLKKGEKALLCLPANYIAGKMMIVRSLIGELKLNYIKPTLDLKISSTEKFDLIAIIPSMLSAILKSGKEKNLEIFKNILLGGSNISQADEKQLSILNNQIWHTYGMTETITHIALRRINGNEHSELFTPLQGIDLSISNEGTLVINYPKLGITNLVTNDLSEINKNGYFKILGRKDNVIISGALKLHPEELEKKIENIFKNKYFIFGIPDEKLGQKAILFIEGEIKESPKQLFFKFKQVLHKNQIPKEIIMVKYFEKTKTGKLIRKNYQ